MSGLHFAFLLLPCIAAVSVAYAVRHWALAAATLAGALGCFLMVPVIGGDARLFTPLFTGAAVAAATLIPLLAWKPDGSIWTRMTIALGVAFAVHFAFFQYAMATR